MFVAKKDPPIILTAHDVRRRGDRVEMNLDVRCDAHSPKMRRRVSSRGLVRTCAPQLDPCACRALLYARSQSGSLYTSSGRHRHQPVGGEALWDHLGDLLGAKALGVRHKGGVDRKNDAEGDAPHRGALHAKGDADACADGSRRRVTPKEVSACAVGVTAGAKAQQAEERLCK